MHSYHSSLVYVLFCDVQVLSAPLRALLQLSLSLTTLELNQFLRYRHFILPIIILFIAHLITPITLKVYDDTMSTHTISVARTTTGTKEYVECSNRGTCTRTSVATTGAYCTCTTNAARSNGAGATGIYADCGHDNGTPLSF